MNLYSKADKSQRLINETVDLLRNKPINSTYMERLQLTWKAAQLYEDLPQPIQLGYAMNYILENCSCPVAPHDILMGRYPEVIPTEEEEKQLQENHPALLVDGGHTCFDWEEILRIGIAGYIEKTEREMQRRLTEGSAKEHIIVLQGMNLICQAYRRYMLRYADAAASAGNTEAETVCRNIADNPPSTFLEAVQLILFIVNTYSIYSARANATMTCGRMDDLLLPYYEKDIAAGILTREDAGYIIDDFNCKNSLIIGRGEHQMSYGTAKDTGWDRNPMYDSPTYVIIGGYSNHTDHTKNPLTTLFLEHIHPRLENPVYVYRRTASDSAEQWRLVCDKLRQNATLLVYNDETVIPSFRMAGVDEYDGINYTIHGCNWPDTQGLNEYTQIGGPITDRIYYAMWDNEGNLLENFESIDSIYEKLAREWREYVRARYAEARAFAQRGPLPQAWINCVSCFQRNTIENAAASHHNGTKYIFTLNLQRNIGTAADMMAALETVVFGDDPVPLSTLTEAMKANFAGYEALWKRCRLAPKYGQDNDLADKHAVRLMKMFTDITHEETFNPATGKQDVYALNVTITDMRHRIDGERLPATPDGRLSGAPLSENLSPSVGSTQSVTALLNSVSKLPFERISSGALNVRMPKNLVSGDDGLDRLAILLDTYFENGGMQVQLNVADTAELRDAKLHPEKYPDLMVRITGYSAVFVDMCDSAQNEIIRRDEVS